MSSCNLNYHEGSIWTKEAKFLRGWRFLLFWLAMGVKDNGLLLQHKVKVLLSENLLSSVLIHFGLNANYLWLRCPVTAKFPLKKRWKFYIKNWCQCFFRGANAYDRYKDHLDGQLTQANLAKAFPSTAGFSERKARNRFAALFNATFVYQQNY